MIACTNIQNFVEKEEECASPISVGHLEPFFHTIGYDINLCGSYLILFGSIFKFQEPPVMRVVVLINFGVKNQVPQFSFEVVADDLMSVLFYEFSDIIFYGSLYILEIILYFRSDPFILFDIELPTNSYMIACTNIQNFVGK